MTTERELIEAAAAQAGYGSGVWTDGAGPYSGGPGLILPDGRLWNPIRNPGQCFDLQLRCFISLEVVDEQWRGYGEVGFIIRGKSSRGQHYLIRNMHSHHALQEVKLNADEIRRAIVDVAYRQWEARQ